jgi:hypothetical protein
MAKKSVKKHPVIAEAPMLSTAMDKKWRAESDLRTLQQAGEIQADRSRVTAAKKLAAEQARALTKICK